MKKKCIVLLLLFAYSFLFFSCNNEQKTLKIWHTEVNPDAIKFMNTIVHKFEMENPNIKVEIEAIPWNSISDKINAALASGTTPDIIQPEPYMVYSLYSKNLLEPMDDIINYLGKDRILPCVRDLFYYDNHYYGIGYALGVSNYVYRKDIADSLGITTPKTWSEYLELAKRMTLDLNKDGKIDIYGTCIPGGESFFVDQLFCELMASNNGKLFNEKGIPNFNDEKVKQVLLYMKDLTAYCPKDWTSIKYVDQFRDLSIGRIASVQICFARAAKQIEKDANPNISDPQHFAIMIQPVGPSGITSYASQDDEPWIVLKSSNVKPEAKEFIKFFYKKENYIKFCNQVPIHLIPIIKEYAQSKEYLDNPFLIKWKPWYDQAIFMINEERMHPQITMDKKDMKIPFLREFQSAHIITDLVTSVCVDNKDVNEAMRATQIKAEKFLKELGYLK